MLTAEQRSEIRRRVVEPFLDLSDVIAEDRRDSGAYCPAKAPTGRFQETEDSERRVADLSRLFNSDMSREEEKAENKRAELAAIEERRKKLEPSIVADFLAGTNRPELARRYGANMVEVRNAINEGTTEEQRHRVWCTHQSRRQKAYDIRAGRNKQKRASRA